MKRWTKEQIEKLTNEYLTTSYSDFAESFNRTESSIRAKCFELGLVKKDKWDEEDIQFVIDNYSEMKTSDIAKKLNRTDSAIRIKARKLSLNKTDYNCDYDYFQVIDTEEKAYWLGFICADGWINVNEETNAGTTGIELQIGDIDHLKKFNKSIGGNYKIDTRERVCSLNNKLGESCQIRIYSIKFVNHLINLGLTNNKTFDLEMPQIDDDLMCHFVRGFFDGDGCIAFHSRKSQDVAINFTNASSKLINKLKEYLYEKGIYSYISEETPTNEIVYRLYIKGLENTDKMWNWMFSNATIYLDRKKKKKESLYRIHNIAQRLPRQSEMVGF